MRRFLRRSFGYLFTFIAGCSALACLLAAVLWARGYFVSDEFKYTRFHPISPDKPADTRWVVASSRGSIGLAVTDTSGLTWPPEANRSLTWGKDWPPALIAPPSTTPWGKLGFQFIAETVPLGNVNALIMVIGIIVPSWFAVLVSAMPPIAWYVLWRRRRMKQMRVENGQCVRCGYDLRGSP